MQNKIREILRKVLPDKAYGFLKIIRQFLLDLVLRFQIQIVMKKHQRVLIRVRRKDRIKVVFFLLETSNWKYDSVYKLMEMEERFEPLVVVCPLTNGLFNPVQIQEKLKRGELFCQKMNYKFINTWLEDGQCWLDVKKTVKPDIIFFTIPHQITVKEYCIENYLDTLTCYVPYSVRSDHLVNLAFNQRFEQLTWINFYETRVHGEIATQVALNKGRNVEIVGYPTFDELIEKSKKHKLQPRKKTIIWAPHWTVGNDFILNRSCFFEFYDFFIDLANSYQDEINVILRPHPFLKATLSKKEWWGKEKTEAYFQLWQEKPNLSINEDDYTDIFAASDLLVHDSVSFLTEYLVTGKPSIFTKRKIQIDPPFNRFGKICLEAHYVIDSKEELQKLVQTILFDGMDEKYTVRQDFIAEYIEPNLNSAEKIVGIIGDRLF